MRTYNKISKRLNRLTNENLLVNRRVIAFNNAVEAIWMGTKRYAH
ncbi:hypothetical protein V8G69_10505 [Gaetbulibacter sp. M235]